MRRNMRLILLVVAYMDLNFFQLQKLGWLKTYYVKGENKYLTFEM